MLIAINSLDSFGKNIVRGRAFMQKRTPFSHTGSMSERYGRRLSLVLASERLCLLWLLCDGILSVSPDQMRVVRVPESTRTQRARKHRSEKVRLDRVEAGTNSIEILKEQLVCSELRCKKRLEQDVTLLLVKILARVSTAVIGATVPV